MTLAKVKNLYNQDFALWIEATVKQLKIGEKPNLIEMNQVTLSTENNCPSSKYLPPSCKGKICTIIQPPWHLAGSRSDEGRGPPLIGTFKGKILIDQVDLEKAQNEDSALLLVKSWFNSVTGKIEKESLVKRVSKFNQRAIPW